MEFPHVGTTCSGASCSLLDFLPMKCDACSNIFCKDHITYASHHCSESYKKDNQVPVCPLCNKLVPLGPGEVADIKVGSHIDADCQSDPAKERRGTIFKNRCCVKGCRTREMVKVECSRCHRNFCLKHRHEKDHSCLDFVASPAVPSSARATAKKSSAPKKSTDDERRDQEKTDLAIAQELQRIEDEDNRRRLEQQRQRASAGRGGSEQQKDSCRLS